MTYRLYHNRKLEFIWCSSEIIKIVVVYKDDFLAFVLDVIMVMITKTTH